VSVETIGFLRADHIGEVVEIAWERGFVRGRLIGYAMERGDEIESFGGPVVVGVYADLRFEFGRVLVPASATVRLVTGRAER